MKKSVQTQNLSWNDSGSSQCIHIITIKDVNSFANLRKAYNDALELKEMLYTPKIYGGHDCSGQYWTDSMKIVFRSFFAGTFTMILEEKGSVDI